MTPLAAALGVARAVIPHCDDLGATWGANAAFLQLAAAGHVTCGSVMVPCPWFPALAEAAARDPSLDLGVHLTLTSEWRGYRWRPLSTRWRASGLVDADGCFPATVAELAARLVPEAVEAELRAQLDTAIAAGLRPTHIDAHMAAAMLPALLPLHLRLADAYRVVPVLPRNCPFAPDPTAYAAALAAEQRPLPDAIRGTLPVPADALEHRWGAVLHGLPPGVTHLALHPTLPDELARIEPRHAAWRADEAALLATGALGRLCEAAGIARIGYRAIQRLWWPEA